jgi:hypothetical protein
MCCCVIVAALPVAAQELPTRPHDRAFWVALRDGGFALPPGESADGLLRASEPLLASRDPVLRDEVAYGLAVAWIYRARLVADAEVRALAVRLRGNLRVPASEGDADAVLRRSFSALVLSVIAAADLRQPVLDDRERAATVEAATAYLRDERDQRGYDPQIGWVHATAHCADLLKFLARSPRLTKDDQRRIAEAVIARTDRPGPAFSWGEDDRLAQVWRALVLRADADLAPLDAWLERLPPSWKALWKTPALETDAFARLRNAKHVLRSLHTGLAATKELPPAALAVRDRVLATLSAIE